MIEKFRQSNAVASLLLVQPTASFDIVSAAPGGLVQEICPLTRSDIWINGGFFVMRNEIFRYIRARRGTGARTVPAADRKAGLAGVQVHWFWQCMDTFKDKQRLEELNQDARRRGKSGTMPEAAASNQLRSWCRPPYDPAEPANGRGPKHCRFCASGCHSDDIEIGCGGTILRLAEAVSRYCDFHWVVFSAIGVRDAGSRTRRRIVRRSSRG